LRTYELAAGFGAAWRELSLRSVAKNPSVKADRLTLTFEVCACAQRVAGSSASEIRDSACRDVGPRMRFAYPGYDWRAIG